MSKFDSLYNEVIGEAYIPTKVKGQTLYGLGPIDYGHGDNPSDFKRFWQGTSAKQILRDTSQSSVIEDSSDYSLERTVDGVQIWGADEFVIYIGRDKNKIMEVAMKDYESGGDFTQSAE